MVYWVPMNWQRWIRPGLVLTLLVAIVAIVVRSGTIQHDLATRVLAELADDGQGWANVEVSARDVTIVGTAPSIDAQTQAVRGARSVGGVRAVYDASDLLPIVSPYVWSAHREGSAVILAGSVPSEGARAAVLAAARRALPDGEIRDTMLLARGAPVSFNAATTFGLARLADLSEGTVTLTDATLAASGTARDATTFAGSGDAFVKELPASVNLGPVAIQPPLANPFVWSATYDGKQVTLVGYVPNDVVRETLVAAVKAALPGVPIADTVALASGAPPGFAEAASFAIGALDRLNQGGVTLDGLKLDVSGEAKSVEDYETLLASLSGPLPAGLTVVSSAIEPASVSPYGWQGDKKDGAVVLTGYVPSAADLDDVAAAARIMFAGSTLDDRLRVAAGAPRMDWIGAIKFAMGELAKLDHGEASISEQAFSIDGVALTPEAYAAIRDANSQTLPASLALGAANVSPPAVSPYRFDAQRAGSGVVISGYAPDDATRQAILAAAHQAFGSGKIDGDLTFAAGAPADFGDASTAALEALSRLAGGHVDVADQAVEIDGIVYQPAAVNQIADGLSGALPAGYTIKSDTIASGQDGQPVAADGCRDLLQAVLQTGRIEFDGNTADISADSLGVLDRVAAAISRCSDVTVEVGAYSDADGSAARNRDRTQARADAIVEFLVDAGVRRERLTAVGYGEVNPVADNSTEEGKAANRRIEFSVKLPDGG